MFLTKKTYVRKRQWIDLHLNFKDDSTLFLFVVYCLSLNYIHTGGFRKPNKLEYHNNNNSNSYIVKQLHCKINENEYFIGILFLLYTAVGKLQYFFPNFYTWKRCFKFELHLNR